MKYIVEYYTLFVRKSPYHMVYTYKIEDEKTDTKTEHTIMTQLSEEINYTTVIEILFFVY